MRIKEDFFVNFTYNFKKEEKMSTSSLIILAVGVSMDAFAVSICKGLSVERLKLNHCLICGIWFGGFQALMPLCGYLLGTGFSSLITAIDHWIAVVLLGLIGANMIREALSPDDEEVNASFSPKTMLPLAVATSIDALAVGVTFAALRVNIVIAVIMIGITTFAFSACGTKIGQVFGERFKSKAEIFGGIVLIAIGAKILIEHLAV